MRGSPERVISSLRAFGPGDGQIPRVVRVSARAPFEFFSGKVAFADRIEGGWKGEGGDGKGENREKGKIVRIHLIIA